MNFNQLAIVQRLKGCMENFRLNHPKFPLFLNAISQEALIEGSVIEITVTTPEGKNYCSNIRLRQEDLELIECMKALRQN